MGDRSKDGAYLSPKFQNSTLIIILSNFVMEKNTTSKRKKLISLGLPQGRYGSDQWVQPTRNTHSDIMTFGQSILTNLIAVCIPKKNVLQHMKIMVII